MEGRSRFVEIFSLDQNPSRNRKETNHDTRYPQNSDCDRRLAGHRSRSGESFPRSPLQCGGDFAEHYKDRRFKASEKLELVDGSIADPATATRIVEAAKRQFGAIDALVNNVMHENMSSTSAIACAPVSNRFGV